MLSDFGLIAQAGFQNLVMALRDTLWANIKRHLDSTGESLTSLALRSGVPQSTLQRFSKGTHRSLSLDHIERLARAMSVDPSSLFEPSSPAADPRVQQAHVVMQSLPDYAKDAALATLKALGNTTKK
jgi:transcriptional regulator with XRE-family HTH domain